MILVTELLALECLWLNKIEGCLSRLEILCAFCEIVYVIAVIYRFLGVLLHEIYDFLTNQLDKINKLRKY